MGLECLIPEDDRRPWGYCFVLSRRMIRVTWLPCFEVLPDIVWHQWWQIWFPGSRGGFMDGLFSCYLSVEEKTFGHHYIGSCTLAYTIHSVVNNCLPSHQWYPWLALSTGGQPAKSGNWSAFSFACLGEKLSVPNLIPFTQRVAKTLQGWVGESVDGMVSHKKVQIVMNSRLGSSIMHALCRPTATCIGDVVEERCAVWKVSVNFGLQMWVRWRR